MSKSVCSASERSGGFSWVYGEYNTSPDLTNMYATYSHAHVCNSFHMLCIFKEHMKKSTTWLTRSKALVPTNNDGWNAGSATDSTNMPSAKMQQWCLIAKEITDGWPFSYAPMNWCKWIHWTPNRANQAECCKWSLIMRRCIESDAKQRWIAVDIWEANEWYKNCPAAN